MGLDCCPPICSLRLVCWLHMFHISKTCAMVRNSLLREIMVFGKRSNHSSSISLAQEDCFFLSIWHCRSTKQCRTNPINKINSLGSSSSDLLPNTMLSCPFSQPGASTKTPRSWMYLRHYLGNSGWIFCLTLLLLEDNTTTLLLKPESHAQVANTDTTKAGCAHHQIRSSQLSEAWYLYQLSCARIRLNISC